MVTVLGMWELGWMGARAERRLWKQTIQAFGVERWAMCDVQDGPFTSPTQYPDVPSMLAAHPGRKTFLIPPGRRESKALANYVHLTDAIYVFGRAGDNLVRFVSADDDVVSIHTPVASDLFGAAALSAVLYDRLVK